MLRLRRLNESSDQSFHLNFYHLSLTFIIVRMKSSKICTWYILEKLILMTFFYFLDEFWAGSAL